MNSAARRGEVGHLLRDRWYTGHMPTTRPRYQVTDTGTVRALLDRAAVAWPDERQDRKALLVRLARLGAEHLPEAAVGTPSLDDALAVHRGSWVAVRGDRLLVAASTVTEVAAWLRERGERADQLFRVPAAEGDVVTEHGLA
jgi:hypothetical protein